MLIAQPYIHLHLITEQFYIDTDRFTINCQINNSLQLVISYFYIHFRSPLPIFYLTILNHFMFATSFLNKNKMSDPIMNRFYDVKSSNRQFIRNAMQFNSCYTLFFWFINSKCNEIQHIQFPLFQTWLNIKFMLPANDYNFKI